jgi:general secretion pathway protein K
MRIRQRGVAVVLAMGVVALAAIAAAAMLASQSTWSRHTELRAEHVQAQALVAAGVDYTRALLSEDRRVSSVDHLGEPWALRVPPVPVDNGELSGRIEDQQGAFNVNNLYRNGNLSPTHVAQFRRLLEILGLPDSLADAVLALNRPLIDVAELALVPGFDAAVRARLRPFITALPRYSSVNVNTATPEVLAALVRDLELEDARALAEQRNRAYFRNLSEFLMKLPPGAAVDGNDITTASQYFIATVRVTIGEAQARGTALLARESNAWPTVVWRKYP